MIRRHPIRGFLGGLLVGIGLSLLLVIYGTAPLGAATVLVVVLLFAVIGTGAAWFLPTRSRPVVVETTATAPEDTYRP